jgi:fido (protein-threonine AMPylation protein)
MLSGPALNCVVSPASRLIRQPGDVFGNLAFAHPFLDGNGRTLMVVHAVLANRAGISIDWSATDKTAFLAAVTKRIKHPGKGHLDTYLEPFFQKTEPGAISPRRSSRRLVSMSASGRRCSARQE